MALLDLAAYKARMGLGTLTAAQDAQITALLVDMEAALVGLLGKPISPTAVTEYFDGRADPSVVLRYRPIRSVTSVKDDPDGVFSGAALPTTSYRPDTARGIVELIGSNGAEPWLRDLEGDGFAFTDGVKNVEVVYQAGFPDGHPALVALKPVLCEMVSRFITVTPNTGVESKTIGDYSISFGNASGEAAESGLSAASQAIIDRWKGSGASR